MLVPGCDGRSRKEVVEFTDHLDLDKQFEEGRNSQPHRPVGGRLHDYPSCLPYTGYSRQVSTHTGPVAVRRGLV